MLPLLFIFFLISFGSCQTVINGVTVSTPSECIRPCQVNTPPKTCYYQFTIEDYQVLNRACEVCTPKHDNQFTSECQCITADGVEKTFKSVNRQFPGPSIQVCQNDTVVVDVKNMVEDAGVTIHWHGVWQKGTPSTPYYDGVPHVTQCPIAGGTTFRYKWLAYNQGTHFWHSHSGLQKVDGICGSLVIRVPKPLDASHQYYDYDLPAHVILLNDWMHERADDKNPGRLQSLVGNDADSILINGKGQTNNPLGGCTTTIPLATFEVQPGKRYRFRLINAIASACPVQVTIEQHNVTVIASDGVSVQPELVSSIISFSGERYDFVLEANGQSGAFWIQVQTSGPCLLNNLYQVGILRYTNSKLISPSTPKPTVSTNLVQGRVLNPLNPAACSDPSTGAICVQQLVRTEAIQGDLSQKPDVQIYSTLTFDNYPDKQFYAPGYYGSSPTSLSGALSNFLIDHIYYEPPPSNLLSQFNDIDPTTLCNNTSKLPSCNHTLICACVHLYKVPLNGLLEIVLLDPTPLPLSHPFHLHGGVYQVVAVGLAPPGLRISEELFKEMDTNGTIKRNFLNAPEKDTLAVPNNGYAVLRIRAENPGFWFFHCHYLFHTLLGMNMVLQFGEVNQMPKVPPGFPTCRNFMPDI